MSVASKNPFALLGDDDGPAVAAPAKTAAPDAKGAAQAPRRNVVGAGGGARGGDAARGNAAAAGERGGRGGNRGGGAPRGAAAGAEEGGDAPQKDVRAGRGRDGGRGRGRGRGGAARGRAFDRHSQTGKVDTEKNLHQGWGGDDGKRELEVEQGAAADAAAEGTETPAANGSGWDAPPSGDAAAPAAAAESTPAPAAAVAEEEEDKTKTLDEYLAEQAQKRLALGATRELRPADSDANWEANKITKPEDDAYFVSSTKESARRQREKKEKQVLEIEQTFSRPAVSRPPRGRGTGERGGGGGRGRGGGGRGGGGERGVGGERGRGGARGGYRGGRGGSNAAAGGAGVNLDDSNAFPKLA